MNKWTPEQEEAIYKSGSNIIVSAGAGSGKTAVLSERVINKLNEGIHINELLILTFTNAAANEMKERVKKETNIDLDVMTFHKLGLEIIKKSLGRNVKIFDKDLFQVVKKVLNRNIEDPSYLNKLIYFMSNARFDEKDEFDFTNVKEYEAYLTSNKPTTLTGEIVKSYGELEIANYLFSNNIKYVYEKEYKYNTMIDEYQQYTPDFYLPEYDIYIEYFGIDENKNVAPYFKDKDGKTASEIYNESIEWKRKTHKEHNTIMIETFYYENKQGKLLSNLEKSLKEHNVKINPKTDTEIWDIIQNNNKGVLNETCRAFETIINLIKSDNYSLEQVYSLPSVISSNLNRMTLDLIKPIFEAYQKGLVENEMIDFNDMINLATSSILDNKYIHNYKYVIVDEYQDMSNSRYRLLKAMRMQKDYKLFCVGDDWQSIYRFNGSDVDLITNFEKYWGNTNISYIEKTYRFTSMMSILSGKFIMKNPYQYKKKIDAEMSKDFPIKFVNGYTENNCVNFLEDKLDKFEKNSTVYFLGRYSIDIDMFKNNKKYIIKYNNAENLTDVTYLKRKDLKIRFLTVHKSKGLQADYVVIINNKNYGMGFPSRINDLPLIRVLLGNGLDDYPFSEERRLFYVALTRSRKQTLLLTIDNNKSIFVQELETDYNNLMKNNPELKRNIYKCPKCGGRLILRKGPYGSFFGCSNYPDCKYIKKY
jgi:DNA helicase-4